MNNTSITIDNVPMTLVHTAEYSRLLSMQTKYLATTTKYRMVIGGLIAFIAFFISLAVIVENSLNAEIAQYQTELKVCKASIPKFVPNVPKTKAELLKGSAINR